MLQLQYLLPPVIAVRSAALSKMLRPAAPAAKQLACLSAKTAAISLRLFPASQNEIDPLTGPVHDRSYSTPVCQQFIQQQSGIGGAAILLCRRDIFNAALIDSSLR